MTREPVGELPRSVRRAIDRHSFCTLATISPAGWPHVAGVAYVALDGDLFVHTFASTRKARNVASSHRAAVCIPVRRFPFAPPFCVQFQATAELLPLGDAELNRLLATGRLKRLTRYNVLDDPDTCFVRITPRPTVSTFGIGVPLTTVLRDPTHADRTFVVGDTAS